MGNYPDYLKTALDTCGIARYDDVAVRDETKHDDVDPNELGFVLDALKRFEERTHLLIDHIDIMRGTRTYFCDPDSPIEAIWIHVIVPDVTESVLKRVKFFVRNWM